MGKLIIIPQEGSAGIAHVPGCPEIPEGPAGTFLSGFVADREPLGDRHVTVRVELTAQLHSCVTDAALR
jgi:hypothetical protein